MGNNSLETGEVKVKCATGPRDPLQTKEAYYCVHLEEVEGDKLKALSSRGDGDCAVALG